VRLGFRTIATLALCAAAAASAMAHVTIDIVGDYALAHDTYDDVSHGSRDIVTAVALILATILAVRGLRVCCAIAAANRGRVDRPTRDAREPLLFALGVVVVTALVVPSMECLDGRLAGMPVKELDAAFGGSIALGLGVAVVIAVLVAGAIYAFARWLISHRDSIAAIVETLLRRFAGAIRPHAKDLAYWLSAPRRRRTAFARRLCKRGPPAAMLLR
jgi:hypothetical protein